MYTSPDEARSDLFLAGAVYLFGGLVIGLLLEIVPLQSLPGVDVALAFLVPIVTTALVPHLLVRYRKESWSAYGLGAPDSSFWSGALAGLPLAAASVVTALVFSGDPTAGLPVVAIGTGALRLLLLRLVSWLCLAVLAVYGTVKARDAFRADYSTVRDASREIGRWVGIVLGATTVLLSASFAVRGVTSAALELLLLALAAVGVFALVYRSVPARATTSRATLLTPAVLLALGPFALSFDAAQLVFSLWLASIYAAVGLTMGMLVETRRSALGVIGLAVVIAALSTLGGAAGV